ncbi:CoA-binding protein [Clostridium polynesiense]|uniref:CoA-binding protein n=1 Tax=Clostridium polynesiense TaxID=1325933 RepID=UPI0005917FBC|nr:CoA-binding protein [Clostridium polynesiense]
MKASEFLNYMNWVVVGDVLNPEKYAHKILKNLESSGYKVSGVHPKSEGNEAYKSLGDVPYDIEILDLCINPKAGINIIKEAKEIGVKNVLIQPGAESEEILEYCRENSINAVEGCALVELRNRKQSENK